MKATGTDIRVHYEDKHVRIETFRDKAGQFRWRMIAPRNGKDLNPESHPSRRNAVRALRRVIVLLSTCRMVLA